MSRIAWVFHASDGRGRVLKALIERYINDLGLLLPRVDSDDPLAALEAELSSESSQLDAVDGQPDFERFFPPAVADEAEAAEFRRRAVPGQARNRLNAARRVLANLGEVECIQVPVAVEDIDCWVQVLTAVRMQWHVELTGSSERLAVPTAEALEESPDVTAILDWLALLIEDALQAKWRLSPPGEGR